MPIPGEGQWAPLGPLVDGQAGAHVTAIRPDNVYTSSMDAVVNFDPKYFSFRAYPGTKIPKPWDRPDYVEPERQAALVAAFSGGFRLRDSGGGMILGGTEIQTMKDGIATMSIDQNGVPNVGMWGRDISASSGIDSARQNLTLIVDNGVPNPDLLTDANRKWGFTGPKNKSAVWRSGAGITADGHLVWVGGPGMTIESLAQTLIRAGAIRGMQLEINQEWVQLNTYITSPAGQTNGKRLLVGMQHTGNRWLTEDTRDFVAVFMRN
ncbi:MAG TPA: phosphodiester glycosidase family protein [Propionibacteriaceae bacterium]|nr:phosphodiester glycosidase family protein [Propionibacteriaceae bacterium]